MNEEQNKQKLTLRIIIASVLSLVCLVIGVVCGVKIANSSQKQNNINTNNPMDQVVNILKENWCSDIYYGKELDEDLLIHQFIGALSTSKPRLLDPYTYLLENETTVLDNSGKLGITISPYYNFPVVVDVDVQGAAYNKLLPGDIIVSSGKESNDEYHITSQDITYSTLISSAAGLPGEKIFLKVARFDNDKLNYLDFDFTLKEAAATSYAYEVEDGIDDTIMVKLTSFVSSSVGPDTSRQFENILKNDDSKNLIIDLRDNGGGDLTSVVDICDLFLENNKVVTTLEYKNHDKYSYKTSNADKYDYENIFILQNGSTASASEILISTLTYYFPNKVTLIGTKSYGKGIAQRRVNVLNNAYTLQYTCAKWYRPDGSWIGMTGSFYEDGYQLGFDPSHEIKATPLLSLMQTYNTNLSYKDGSLAYQIDNVANENKLLFEILNLQNDFNCRTDGYFDNTCSEAIKSYQSKHEITVDGKINQETFLYLIADFYNEKLAYSNLHLEAVKSLLN